MSDQESHHHGKNEIIIIKRHGGSHDGVHGGAWKIAYADFMTAMMAFFLVMWLVNAANEETKAAVASYFNPIKLTDPTPATKGLKKPAKDAQGENTQDKSKTDGENKAAGSQTKDSKDANPTTSTSDEVKFSEADYFENPNAVLVEIAKEVNDQANVSVKGDGGVDNSGPGTGALGGTAYKDPFDPDFYTQQVEISAKNVNDNPDNPAETPGLPGDGAIPGAQDAKSIYVGDAKSGDKKSGELTKGNLKSGEGLTDHKGMTTSDAKQTADQSKDKKDSKSTNSAQEIAALDDKINKLLNGKTEKALNGKTDKAQNGKTDKALNGKADKAAEAKIEAVKKLAQELEDRLKKEIGVEGGALTTGLTVEPAEGGLLISVSDQLKTPMFAVGSAVPNRETVIAMVKIAKVLKGMNGAIVIRGHTDGRQYKAGSYDNWRLSTARAESAYFMLLHGGLSEKRIGQVAGYADRHLKVASDPNSAANRRIEILIQANEG
jgi:chemotaxis protein MotB